MAFVTPYITDRFTAYLGDVIITNLSIAVWLTDEYAREEPIGHVKVRVKEGDIEAVKNLSRYYIFKDLADGNYTIDIRSDLYFREEIKVDTSELRALDTLTLEFESSGPLSGETNAKLKDLSNLQVGYVVEFKNPEEKTEQRGIKEIDPTTKKIFWIEGLKYNFSASGSTIRALNYLLEIVLKPKPSYLFPVRATLVRGVVMGTVEPVVNADIGVLGKTIKTITDERGEFILYFKGIKKEDITIEIKKNGDTKNVNATIEEGKTASLGIITFP